MTTTTEAEPQVSPPTQRGDRIFAGLARAAGISILVALAAVFIFLAVEGIPGVNKPASNYAPLDSFLPYVGRLLYGTIFTALIALVIAVPFALGIALFISHYAPPALAVPVAYVIDLLAAVPSVVFGLWGARNLAPYLVPVQQVARGQPRVPPVLRGPGLGHRQDLAHGRRRAGDHDPAHHHRDLPRDLRPDTTPPRGGRARAGRDEVGDDPVRGPPLRPLGHRLRGDARPGPRPRRDHGRGDGPLGQPGGHPQHDLQHQPGNDRLQHRLELRGGDARQAVGADRDRPGAVRVHVRGQLRGALRSWPGASGSSTDDHDRRSTREPRLAAADRATAAQLGAGAGRCRGRSAPPGSWPCWPAGASRPSLVTDRGRSSSWRCRSGRRPSRDAAERSTG